MLYVPKKVPLNWYKYDVLYSTELLRSYIQGVEDQIARSIEEYRIGHEVQSNAIEDRLENDENEPSEMWASHGGLDSESWDLEDIFGEHFPNLQRRSALITLYSFLEHELNKLCDLFVREKKWKVSLNDMRGRGIDRATLFLERVVGLKIDKKAELWEEVTKIRDLRNCIVHADGKLKDGRGKPKDIAKYVQGSPYLSGDDEAKLSGDYLFHVLEIFDRQFQELDNLVRALPTRA
jgi:hypothetical protein